MAQYLGGVQGSKGGMVTRLGGKSNGVGVVAASWEGAVRTKLYYDEVRGEDMAHVWLDKWNKKGTVRTLYHGPVSGVGPLAEPVYTDEQPIAS